MSFFYFIKSEDYSEKLVFLNGMLNYTFKGQDINSDEKILLSI